MKVEGKNYCDTSKVYVAPIAKSIAKDIIVKKHYTHAWTACRYAIGIYYKSEDANTFDGDTLIGCLIYGFPVGAKASTSICEGLTKDKKERKALLKSLKHEVFPYPKVELDIIDEVHKTEPIDLVVTE